MSTQNITRGLETNIQVLVFSAKNICRCFLYSNNEQRSRSFVSIGVPWSGFVLICSFLFLQLLKNTLWSYKYYYFYCFCFICQRVANASKYIPLIVHIFISSTIPVTRIFICSHSIAWKKPRDAEGNRTDENIWRENPDVIERRKKLSIFHKFMTT